MIERVPTKTYPASSYWEVTLSTGKVLSERQLCIDPLRGARHLDWTLDLVSTGDVAKITQIALYTAEGVVALSIDYPQRAFQFKRAGVQFWGDMIANQMTAQIIGRIEEPASGRCRCYIWDALERRLYRDIVTTVQAFAAWRPGVQAPGKLAQEVVGL